jgi:mRNA-degrading endonuclease RelE of RelBE toxin-antitoxin system
MPDFVFTKTAKKNFLKFDPSLQKRIEEKLVTLKNHPAFFSLLEPLQNMAPATHRLRIGDYRFFIEQLSEDLYVILKVGHRRNVYQKNM